ncbi:superoxide dismutase [Candidatus Woesearchaeota archaeon]|nr:superoxide dismutase [Candidatus Woesearchaeota archaeon]
MKHTLPKLGYEYNSLEPFIDAKTMEIHHTKHHQAYIDKLNAALEKYSGLQNKNVDELIKDLSSIPDEIKTAVRNHGGGHSNHSFFWKILKKDVDFFGDVSDAINDKFRSFEEFKKKFSEAALGRFGSGWAWLVVNNNELEIMSTANQDSPISEGKIPILGIDVWEHAYYLKHMSNRAAYVEDFFKVINWEQVEENFKGAQQ